jgi:hypothetical protein
VNYTDRAQWCIYREGGSISAIYGRGFQRTADGQMILMIMGFRKEQMSTTFYIIYHTRLQTASNTKLDGAY